MKNINHRQFSSQPDQEDSSPFSNKFKYEAEIKSVLSKMERVYNIISVQHPEDQRRERIKQDLESLQKQLEELVFWEEKLPEDTKMSDQEWYQLEKVNELKVKKLMTVSKSKFYMLKVNYSKILEQVDYEQADGSFDADDAQKADRLSKDLRREDAASNQKNDMLERLKAPINVQESSENLNSEEQIKLREKIIEKDSTHAQNLDKFTEEMTKALEGTKEFDKMFNESGYADTFKNLKYVDREEDFELKAQSEAEKKKFDELSQRMYGQVDGELDMDLHGNITFR